MEERNLKLAPENTEAVLLITKRKIQPIMFEIYGGMEGDSPNKQGRKILGCLTYRLNHLESGLRQH